MKKIIKVFLMLFVLTLSLAFSINASADTGPKPYITIEIEGNTKGMYMTLLSYDDYRGPWRAYKEDYENYKHYKDNELIAHQNFIEYEDGDGFYYIQYVESIEDNKFNWGYYPPDKFKILIYDLDNDSFITDNKIYQKDEFGTVFKLTLNDTNFSVKKLNTFIDDLLGFFVRLVICLAIEIVIALIFGFRRLELIPILIVNLITQILFNILLTSYIYFNGFQIMMLIPIYIFSEFLILFFEIMGNSFGIRYVDNKYGYEMKTGFRIILYTIVANIVSLIGGFIIITLFNNINFYI